MCRNASAKYTLIDTWTDSRLPKAQCYWDATYDAIYTYDSSSSPEKVYRFRINRSTGAIISDGLVLSYTPDRAFIGNGLAGAYRMSSGVEIIVTLDDSPRKNWRWFERAGDGYSFTQVKIQTPSEDYALNRGRMMETDAGEVIWAGAGYSFFYGNTYLYHCATAIRSVGGTWSNLTKRPLTMPAGYPPYICKNSISGNYDVICPTYAHHGAPITNSYYIAPCKITKFVYNGSTWTDEGDVSSLSLSSYGGFTTLHRVSDGWIIHRNGSNTSSPINVTTNFQLYRAFLGDSGYCSSAFLIPKATLPGDHYLQLMNLYTYGSSDIYCTYDDKIVKWDFTKTRASDKCLSIHDGTNLYGRYE